MDMRIVKVEVEMPAYWYEAFKARADLFGDPVPETIAGFAWMAYIMGEKKPEVGAEMSLMAFCDYFERLVE